MDYKKYDFFQYHSFSIMDETSTDILSLFPQMVQLLSSYIDQNKRVLVHCRAGISRSVSVVLAYLIYLNPDKTYDTIFQELLQIYPRANPNSGFVKQLKQYKDSI
eukprot:TRINITY_DN3876_c0_g2_i1.p1 TRINITY_DN3876_c0_g2~~TRINITY_DN3876_c0_g2_i1.p1  ORF type:complete len:105 (+),score=3.79 TRINITY_DN3876_c0_g2_i1:293-607(+)